MGKEDHLYLYKIIGSVTVSILALSLWIHGIDEAEQVSANLDSDTSLVIPPETDFYDDVNLLDLFHRLRTAKNKTETLQNFIFRALSGDFKGIANRGITVNYGSDIYPITGYMVGMDYSGKPIFFVRPNITNIAGVELGYSVKNIALPATLLGTLNQNGKYTFHEGEKVLIGSEETAFTHKDNQDNVVEEVTGDYQVLLVDSNEEIELTSSASETYLPNGKMSAVHQERTLITVLSFPADGPKKSQYTYRYSENVPTSAFQALRNALASPSSNAQKSVVHY